MADRSVPLNVDSLASLVQNSGCHALRRVAQVLTRLYDDHLEPVGIRATEFAALRVCAAAGPLTVAGFARELEATPRMVRRTLRPLLERDLLAASIKPGSRRYQYQITPSGKQALLAGIQQWELAQGRLVETLGEDGWKRVNKQLSLLCGINR